MPSSSIIALNFLATEDDSRPEMLWRKIYLFFISSSFLYVAVLMDLKPNIFYFFYMNPIEWLLVNGVYFSVIYYKITRVIGGSDLRGKPYIIANILFFLFGVFFCVFFVVGFLGFFAKVIYFKMRYGNNETMMQLFFLLGGGEESLWGFSNINCYVTTLNPVNRYWS